MNQKIVLSILAAMGLATASAPAFAATGAVIQTPQGKVIKLPNSPGSKVVTNRDGTRTVILSPRVKQALGRK
jgi:hypothetical protein